MTIWSYMDRDGRDWSGCGSGSLHPARVFEERILHRHPWNSRLQLQVWGSTLFFLMRKSNNCMTWFVDKITHCTQHSSSSVCYYIRVKSYVQEELRIQFIILNRIKIESKLKRLRLNKRRRKYHCALRACYSPAMHLWRRPTVPTHRHNLTVSILAGESKHCDKSVGSAIDPGFFVSERTEAITRGTAAPE